MRNKSTVIGLVAVALVAGSSGIGYSTAEPMGTPFLQEQIDFIEDLVLQLQDQLNDIQVTWENVTEKPPGFADDIDNDTLALLSCDSNQIAIYDGAQWNCTNSASNVEGGEVALRKLDCILIGSIFDKPIQFNFENGCDLTNTGFDTLDISGTNLSGADLTDSFFDEVNLSDADLSGANLSNVEFFLVDLSGTNFSGANIIGAEFDNSDLNGADFTDATNQPIGEIQCIGTPIGATFTCSD